ncbi:hypothetical protein KUF71_017638 [Frankliniella fusca]|uniref:Uncharacterized protein n=1 Tax=Frankliniella fusca TaxID=407009 RepID=A0AAE1HWY1_9NEOP|nr:hypothetical protein KUF71_017638 [Frankliniella fusca]
MCVVIDHTFHHMFNAATHVGSSAVHTKGWTQHMAHAQHTWKKTTCMFAFACQTYVAQLVNVCHIQGPCASYGSHV